MSLPSLPRSTLSSPIGISPQRRSAPTTRRSIPSSRTSVTGDLERVPERGAVVCDLVRTAVADTRPMLSPLQNPGGTDRQHRSDRLRGPQRVAPTAGGAGTGENPVADAVRNSGSSFGGVGSRCGEPRLGPPPSTDPFQRRQHRHDRLGGAHLLSRYLARRGARAVVLDRLADPYSPTHAGSVGPDQPGTAQLPSRRQPFPSALRWLDPPPAAPLVPDASSRGGSLVGDVAGQETPS